MKLEKKAIILVKALCLSYILTMIFLAILAFIMYQWDVKDKTISIILISIYIISTLSGGFFAGKKMGERKFLWGMAVGVLYLFFFSIVALCLNGEKGFLSANTATTVLLCIASGMFGGMIS